MKQGKIRMAKSVLTFLKGPWRVLTNNPTAGETQMMDEFKESKKPIQSGIFRLSNGRTTTDYFMPVETGDWVYPALNRLTKAGIKFRLGVISTKELGVNINNGRYELPKLVDQSTFCWANASYAFFLMVDGEDKDFTLSALGMEALDMKKTSKRLQEVPRIVQMNASGSMKRLSYKMLTQADVDHQPELFFDGVIFIRKTFAVKGCFSMPDGHEKRKMIALINNNKIGRLIFRLTMDCGLVKGLAVVCEDDQLDADVVFHESALKKEIFDSDNRWQMTAFRHPHIHTAMWDMQSMFHNHTWLLTEERFSQDLDSILVDVSQQVSEGKIPDWILYQEEHGHHEDGTPSMEHAVSGWKKSYQRWQSAGFEVQSSSNILFMAYGSVINQMKAALRKNRWWVPMSNAMLATVTTREALEMIGGFRFHGKSRDEVFYDERFGVVLPGDRFVETADLHDTWDQDGDQAKFIRIKLWSSADPVEYRNTFIIPSYLEVPSTPEEAIDVCVVIRSPNGPGGYSIQRYDADSMPFMRAAEDRVPVIDLMTAPKAMSTLLKSTVVGEVPKSVNYSNRLMSRENALSMISAQIDNPGVGRYANVVMAWSALFGPSYPTELPANGNDIIDTLQQTADADAFGYIQYGVERAEDLLILRAIKHNIPVDSFVFETRFSGAMKEMMYTDTSIDGDKHLSKLVVDGKFARMHKAYLDTFGKVQNYVRTASFELRMASETRNKIMEAIPSMKPNTCQWASEFWTKYNTLLEKADIEYRQKTKGFDISRFAKAFAERKRTEAISKVVEDMYLEITSYESGSPEKWAVALYRWIIDPALTRTKYGKSDRILFQNGQELQDTIMDLLIQGIKNLE